MSCLIVLDNMSSRRVDLPRDRRGYSLEASLWYDCMFLVLRTKPSSLYRHRRGLGLHRVGYKEGDLHIRIAKLAFHAKESPIRTRDEVFNLISS